MTTIIDGTNGITLSGSANQLTFNDSSTQISHAVPQVTTYTSGSGTYTTPTNAKYLTVQMVGGGGGGGGGGNAGTTGAPGQGGTTTFGSNSAFGGVGGPTNSVGGVSTLGTVVGYTKVGAVGQGFGALVTSSVYLTGGSGGASPFGGNGLGGANGTGSAATANSGSGGAAGGNNGAAPAYSGVGGGSGGYLFAVIASPASTYSYAIGAGGTAGTAGTNGYNGGAGGSGFIVVTAYF
jgi:hypothetical protein